MSTLSKFQTYMTGRKALLPLSLVLSAISAIVGMAPYILIWFIIREFIQVGTSSQTIINTYAWWAVGLAMSSIILYFAALSVSHLAAFRVECNMRRCAMKKIINMPLGFFDNNTSGRIRKIIDDNAGITHSFLAHQMPDLASTIVMPLTTAVLIFVFDWRLGLACLIPIFFSMIIMRMMMGKRGRYFMQKYMDSLEEMNTEAVEYVRGIPVVKVFQQTVHSFKNFYNSIIKYKEMVGVHTKMWQIPMSLYTVIINGFAFFLVPIAILLIGNSGNYATVILNLFLYILIVPVFSQSIMRSMYLNQAFGQAKEAIDRLDNLTATVPLAKPNNPQKIKNNDIRFIEVSFTYPEANKKAIDNISFDIQPGQTVALVGASGGGKTTIARLVPRFWDTDEGEVCIGGINVKNIEHKDLMEHISFVFQNTRLFKTSLLENIKYGSPNASLDEVNRAVGLAQCREIIDRLPNGLNTMIGTEGTYLSGGEQQRIALARAFLKNAPIVVLDEATAFTDPENEHLIQQALKKLAEGKTVLMIAHRLTSVVDADKILVINNGKIAEQGTHNELINKKGIYTHMWNEYQQSVKWTIRKEACHA
ncbi:MAG: ABC transporter ATP-binding protein/permease [Bacteroidales bacterium]|nr:ABC transporter ATP-binding protein/permease [Bacteroidales bacterium]